MSARKRHGFVLLWLLGAGLAGLLYYWWHVEAELIGIVETRVHRVGAREGGRVSGLTVEIGDPVTAGKVLARLDTSDIEAEKARLDQEMASLDTILEADRQRFAMEYDRGRLQVEYRSAWLDEKTADLAGRRAELAALETEIKRLRSAEKDGLGHTRDLSDLVIRRNAVSRYINAHSRPATKPAGPTDDKAKAPEVDEEAILRSLSADRLERVEEIRHQLVILDQRTRLREVMAPVDGYVVEILARPGDTLPAFSPIVAVEETQASYVDVYLPETEDAPSIVGQRVEVLSKRGSEYNAFGRVTFVYPGYMPIPDRLMFRRQVAWALKIRVELEDGHGLLPGESVKVHVVTSGVEASEASGSRSRNMPRPMGVPEELKALSRFEPSGVVWLADIERYLVVSDDTGFKGRDNHAPWVFFMDRAGRVEPEPVPIKGLESVNDLEAVTLADGDIIYLVSSQSMNRAGNRPAARQLLVRVRRTGRQLEAVGSVQLLPRWKEVMGADEQGFLDVEGMAWRDGTLYFGLKQPLGPEGALIWKMERVDALFTAAAVRPGPLTLHAAVDLGSFKGQRAGFSDLAFGPTGDLYALSTIPGAKGRDQEGAFLRLGAGSDRKLTARVLARFPGLKPEGLCTTDGNGFLMVFDTGADIPLVLQSEVR